MKPTLIASVSSGTQSLLKTCINKFGFDDYIEPLPLYFPRYGEYDGGECGSLESLLKRPMVDSTSSCNITPYHQHPNFPMAHHHLAYPPPMGYGDIQGDASNGSTSQCATDDDVEFPTEDGNGGFHSYGRSPQPTPADPPSSDMEMSLELPAHLNQEVVEITSQEQDEVIPDVARIMHSTHPSHVKISDDAKRTMYHCMSEFICFVTYEANAHCQREQRNTITVEDVDWVINKFGFDDYIEPLPYYFPPDSEDDGGERGSLTRESLLKRPMVDTASSSNITPYNLPPNFPMAHHHFVYPPPMGNGDMQGEASTSQCAGASVDTDVESPMEEDKE